MGDFNNPTRPARHWLESEVKRLEGELTRTKEMLKCSNVISQGFARESVRQKGVLEYIKYELENCTLPHSAVVHKIKDAVDNALAVEVKSG